MQKAQEIAKNSPTAWIIGGVVTFFGIAGTTRFAAHFFKALRPYQTTVGLPVAALLSTPFFVQALRVRSALQNASPTNSNPTSETSPPTTRRTSGPSPAGNSSPGEQSSDTRTPTTTSQHPHTNSAQTQQVPVQVQARQEIHTTHLNRVPGNAIEALLQDPQLPNKEKIREQVKASSDTNDQLLLIFQHAIAKQANPDFLEKIFATGFCPSQEELSKALTQVAKSGTRDTAKALLKHSATPISYLAQSPIWIAADKGNSAVLQELLNAVSSSDSWKTYVEPKSRNTALHAAAAHGHVEAVSLLLEKVAGDTAYVNRRNRDGLSAIFLAAYHRQEAIVQLLKDRSDINAFWTTKTGPRRRNRKPSSINTGIFKLMHMVKNNRLEESVAKEIFKLIIKEGWRTVRPGIRGSTTRRKVL